MSYKISGYFFNQKLFFDTYFSPVWKARGRACGRQRKVFQMELSGLKFIDNVERNISIPVVIDKNFLSQLPAILF